MKKLKILLIAFLLAASFTVPAAGAEDYDSDAVMLAKTLYGEYRGPDKDQQAAVCWCVLNRVGEPGFADTISGVITQPYQFAGYSESHPVMNELYQTALDVLARWELEGQGVEDVGRVLPKEYKWFCGDGRVNYFRDAYINGNIWGWELESPYKEESK